MWRRMRIEKNHINNDTSKKILSNHYFLNISKIDDGYVLFRSFNDRVFYIDISNQVFSQINLFQISVYIILVMSIFAYFVSLYFVRISLWSLNKLVDYSKNMCLENLDSKILIEWPENDEIKIVAKSFNRSLEKISIQTNALKDFIANVSHELKTPLMEISSEIDYSLKSKNYKEGLDNLKNDIKRIDSLLENLILITKIDADTKLKTEKVWLDKLLTNILKNLSKNYKNKQINVVKRTDEIVVDANRPSLQIILNNLIENAFKYSNPWGIVEIVLDKQYISIKDNWIWIAKKNIKKIWDRFWQEDESKTENNSFWVWLYIVKRLVQLHNWQINVETVKWKGTTFTILFD